MKTTKSRLPLAIAAAIGSATLVVAPASQAQPPLGDAPTNTGQVATAYYIAQPDQGWQTLFNMTNTTDNALAVKVRVKEYKNSRDALDFWIMLSPYDVWTGWLQQDGDGVYMYTNDNSCTSPIFEGGRKELVTQAFYGPGPDNADDGGSVTPEDALERLKMGHVEFIVAGECDYSDTNPARCQVIGPENPVTGERNEGIGWLTKHDLDGVPNNCVKADAYFRATDPEWPEGGPVPGSGNPVARGLSNQGGVIVGYLPPVTDAPIKVNVAYLQAGTGTGAATDAMHLDRVTTGNDLIAAQNYPWFNEPTIATASRGLWDMTGLLQLEQRFTWTSSMQEWSVNAANGVQTSIMLNFPTKGYHVDQQCNEHFASNNRWRWDGINRLACATAADVAANNGIEQGKDYSPSTASPPYAVPGGPVTGTPAGIRTVSYWPTLQPFPRRWAGGMSDIGITFKAFDREEFMVDQTFWSPNRDVTRLPWEVALISFDPTGGAFGVFSGEIYIDAPEKLTAAAGRPINNGWIDVMFESKGYTDYDDANFNTGVLPNGATRFDVAHGTAYRGLPHQGMMVKTRDLGVPGTAYGQGTVNGYRWEGE